MALCTRAIVRRSIAVLKFGPPVCSRDASQRTHADCLSDRLETVSVRMLPLHGDLGDRVCVSSNPALLHNTAPGPLQHFIHAPLDQCTARPHPSLHQSQPPRPLGSTYRLLGFLRLSNSSSDHIAGSCTQPLTSMWPASTGKATPVIRAASGEFRKTAASAICIGLSRSTPLRGL